MEKFIGRNRYVYRELYRYLVQDLNPTDTPEYQLPHIFTSIPALTQRKKHATILPP